MLAITCFLLLTASCAHAAQQICAPDQLEGLIATKQYSNFSYDATNSRRAVTTTQVVDGVPIRTFYLIRPVGQRLMQFQMNLDAVICASTPLQSFPKFCIPDDANSTGEAYLGESGGLKLYFYTGTELSIPVEMSVSKDGDDFWPVATTFSGTSAGVSSLSTTVYLNLTKGINDPSVFDVPAACKKVKTMQKRSFSNFRLDTEVQQVFQDMRHVVF